MLASLSHPSIPAYLHADVRQDPDGSPCLVLVQEYIEGVTLAAVAEEQLIDESKAREVARDVLEVLVYLHGRNPPVVHRDIKPSNLILRPDGGISVIDFGALQSVLRSDKTVGSTLIGTPGFVAPEQMMGRAIPASDLYSLGATLVQLLSGHHPSELPSRGLRIEFEKDVNVSPAFAGFLRRLLAPSVDDRFGAAAEALAVLKALPSDDLPYQLPDIEAAPRRRWVPSPSRNARLIAIVGILSVLLLSGLWATGVYEINHAHGELTVDARASSGEAVPNARVYLDDELVCLETPCHVGSTKTGEHRIRVEAYGRPTRVRDVKVDANTTTHLQFGY